MTKTDYTKFDSAEKVYCIYRNFGYPDKTKIKVGLYEKETFRVEELFQHLSLNLEQLKLIFIFGNGAL